MEVKKKILQLRVYGTSESSENRRSERDRENSTKYYVPHQYKRGPTPVWYPYFMVTLEGSFSSV